ncbi:MAG TPA: hypothetical protein VGR31_10385 [Planctomycetota bacterium]|jgi:hypothetical protein|nr:hypothetical protein [Planctomycetota bacterium]
MTTVFPPLSREQIEVAKAVYDRAVQWQRCDRALHLLREQVPGFGAEATLLKVAAINTLYSTNVYAVVRVAEHVSDVMAGAASREAGPDLVERLANVPAGGAEKHPRRRYSFASKFAHFFVEPEQFPIFDRYANEMVRELLGDGEVAIDSGRPYEAFVRSIERVEAAMSVKISRTSLDHYLLIAGEYRAFKQGHGAEIGGELRQLFEEGRLELEKLLPPPWIPPLIGASSRTVCVAFSRLSGA